MKNYRSPMATDRGGKSDFSRRKSLVKLSTPTNMASPKHMYITLNGLSRGVCVNKEIMNSRELGGHRRSWMRREKCGNMQI